MCHLAAHIQKSFAVFSLLLLNMAVPDMNVQSVVTHKKNTSGGHLEQVTYWLECCIFQMEHYFLDIDLNAVFEDTLKATPPKK